jgi:hypothetical protein
MKYLRVFNSLAEEAKNEAHVRGADLFLPDPVSAGQRNFG